MENMFYVYFVNLRKFRKHKIRDTTGFLELTLTKALF